MKFEAFDIVPIFDADDCRSFLERAGRLDDLHAQAIPGAILFESENGISALALRGFFTPNAPESDYLIFLLQAPLAKAESMAANFLRQISDTAPPAPRLAILRSR